MIKKEKFALIKKLLLFRGGTRGWGTVDLAVPLPNIGNSFGAKNVTFILFIQILKS